MTGPASVTRANTCRHHAAQVGGVGDHLNFRLRGNVTSAQNARFRETCVRLGVPVGWMRSDVNARWHVNWRKYGTPAFDLPNTDELLAAAYDLKIPPHFSDEELKHVAAILAYAARDATKSASVDDTFAA